MTRPNRSIGRWNGYLPAYNKMPVPLNWVLSEETARAIGSPFSNDQVCNATEQQHLRSTLGSNVASPAANPATACN